MEGHVQRAPWIVGALETLIQDQPAFNTDQRVAGTLSKICKAWKAAVQNANTHALDARVAPQKIVSFVSWFHKNFKLVRSISVVNSRDRLRFTADQLNVLNQNLGQCLQLAARNAIEEGTIFQLVGYSSNLCYGKDILMNLPGETLTYLHLHPVSSIRSRDVAIGLRSLRNLTDLQIRGRGMAHSVDMRPCMAAIAGLSKLTNLVLQWVSGVDSQSLPVQLRQLDIEYGQDVEVVADFTHLAQPQRLKFMPNDEQTQFSGIPQQLEVLEVSWGYDLSLVRFIPNIQQATGLQKISILYACETAQQLLVLANLQNLQHLQLSYRDRDDLLAAFEFPPHIRLPMLVNFRYWLGKISPTALTFAMESVVNVARGLTRLELECPLVSDQLPPMALCGLVARLTELRGLSMRFEVKDQEVGFVPEDVQLLRSLTKLTQLNLRSAGDFVCDEDVVELIFHLRQLRSLTVPLDTPQTLRTIFLFGTRDLTHLVVGGGSYDMPLPDYLFEGHIKTVDCDPY